MKKIFLLATFAALTMGAQAQESRKVSKEDRKEMRQKMTPDERADRQTEMMQKRLQLTDAQTAKVREVNREMVFDKNKMSEDRKALRNDRMELMKKREEMYAQVLTKDQMEQFRTLKEERMDKMKKRRVDRKNGSAPRLNNEVK